MRNVVPPKKSTSYTLLRWLRAMTAFGVLFACCAGCAGNDPPEPAYQNIFIAKTSPKRTHVATFYNYSKGGGSGFLGATVTRPLYVNVRRRVGCRACGGAKRRRGELTM
ncbi:MAG: hypothetical protein H7145_20370 [Akkermansiaceae bacterium]|nr:hypothetical protein [Armatimonadota bacterium]